MTSKILKIARKLDEAGVINDVKSLSMSLNKVRRFANQSTEKPTEAEKREGIIQNDDPTRSLNPQTDKTDKSPKSSEKEVKQTRVDKIIEKGFDEAADIADKAKDATVKFADSLNDAAANVATKAAGAFKTVSHKVKDSYQKMTTEPIETKEQIEKDKELGIKRTPEPSNPIFPKKSDVKKEF